VLENVEQATNAVMVVVINGNSRDSRIRRIKAQKE
jgi:hypothetical protein